MGYSDQPTFDDIDSKPGAAVSFLRTFIGLHLRRVGGWISTANIIELLQAVHLQDAVVRNAIVRVKSKGLLISSRGTSVGYRLNPNSLGMLARGDRRIFEIRAMSETARWCVVSFSLPESKRSLRQRLRSRLSFFGAGQISNSLWVAPDYLKDDLIQIFEDHAVEYVMFSDAVSFVSGDLAEMVTGWWPLDQIRDAHQSFLEKSEEAFLFSKRLADLSHTDMKSQEIMIEAFGHHLMVVDLWRPIPYLDPGLPLSLAPSGWPAQSSYKRFFGIHSRLAPLAERYVDEVTRT